MDDHQQEESSLFYLDNSDPSSIIITGEAEENISNVYTSTQEEDSVVIEGNDEKKAVRRTSSILFENNKSAFHTSLLRNTSENEDEEPLICLSNLDISKITNKDNDDHQDRSSFHESTILLNSPLKLARSSNDKNSPHPSPLMSTSAPKVINDTSRSYLHFSIASQPNQNISNDENINEECLLVESIGIEMAKIICKKDPKESIPLLSIVCNLMNCSKAESIIGRTIGRREWAKARKHAIFPGAGEPFEMNFWKNHRKRISNEQLIQFMEWLKAANLIQNLSFGHKVVQYHNGLHVPIESVKRTDSLKNIVNKYYAEFLDVIQQNVDGVEDENNFFDDEASIDSDRSDYEDEQDNKQVDPSNGKHNSYSIISKNYHHILYLVIHFAVSF